MPGGACSVGLMQLPNREKALIAPEKVRDYLLSEPHPVGRHKAPVYRALGYGDDSWEVLRDDLRNHLILDAEELKFSEYGKSTRFEARYTCLTAELPI